MDYFSDLIKRNTWLVILSAIVISLGFPDLGYGIKPYLNALLCVMMFLSCLDLHLGEILKSLSDVKSQVLSLLIIHLASPLIILIFKNYFPPEIFLGLIIASVIPSGRSSVFLSRIYGGIPIKALVTSSLSIALSPVTVPVLVWLFANTTIKIDPISMSYTIIYLVVIPLVVAFLFGRTKPGQVLNRYSTPISTIILFLIILGIISPIKSVVMDNLMTTIVVTLVVMCLIIIDFFLGYQIKPKFADKITYGLVNSYKNYTLGTLLSLSMFNPLVAIPSLSYTIANNLLLVPLQFFFSHKRRPEHIDHHHHRKHNLTMFILGFVASLVISRLPVFNQLMDHLGKFSYISAFIAGAMFASTFTLSAGALILIKLAGQIPHLWLIFLAGIGAVTTDIAIFKVIKDSASDHAGLLYKKVLHNSHLWKILHTPYFAWTLPVIGAIVIASPLPDELGVSLIGLSEMKASEFMAISYISHTIGISLLILGVSMV